jgi:hypothetical protein
MRLGQHGLGGDSFAGDDAVNAVEDGLERARHRSRRGYYVLACRTAASDYLSCRKQEQEKLMPHTKCHAPPLTTKTRPASATNDNCNNNIARISVRDSVSQQRYHLIAIVCRVCLTSGHLLGYRCRPDCARPLETLPRGHEAEH